MEKDGAVFFVVFHHYYFFAGVGGAGGGSLNEILKCDPSKEAAEQSVLLSLFSVVKIDL